jgi:hypothetical protein
MPLQATSGAASYDAFGGGAAAVPQYIEDVFQTWLYTGVGGTQTITNGIDLSGKGGLIWIKNRTSGVTNHTLVDTVRGANQRIFSNLDNGQSSGGGGAASFLSNGFTTTDTASGNAFVSWTFREQPKFFDVVTYTGTGSNTTIAHNLGSVPASIFVKRTDTTSDWQVYHRSLANTEYMVLNTTAAVATGATRWNSTTPTSTVFSIGTDATVNASGGTYVAYLFAHDAGGFGLTGTDNVISCGSYTTDASGNATISLGYEPQWLLWKRSDSTGGWSIYDTMRGWSLTGDELLSANTTTGTTAVNVTNRSPTATGFQFQPTGQSNASATFIYIAIRRGPMKVPTLGTSVFSNNLETTTTNPQTLTTGFPVDMNINLLKSSSSQRYVLDRLRGGSTTSYTYLDTTATTAEATNTGGGLGFDNNTGVVDSNYWNTSGAMFWSWRRAPSFFDEVCYTGNSTNQTLTHNLTVAPTLIIVKKRSGTGQWPVYAQPLGATKYMQLNTTSAETTGVMWNNTAPTASVFSVGADGDSNLSGATYVAYLFATCAGVSKVGSYTGTAALQTVNCGFTSGARFVLIKRTDSTGDWYVYDSARGISSGNDPYLFLNTTAAEVTGTNYVDTDTTGFKVTAAAPAGLNASGGTYIFLAIA